MSSGTGSSSALLTDDEELLLKQWLNENWLEDERQLKIAYYTRNIVLQMRKEYDIHSHIMLMITVLPHYPDVSVGFLRRRDTVNENSFYSIISRGIIQYFDERYDGNAGIFNEL